MNQQSEPAKNSGIDRSDSLLILFLLPLYIFVCGRFGQKFAAAVLVSVATGTGLWLLALIMRPAERNDTERPFCWQLFMVFPLFYPLAMPLWLLPGILAAGYLISLSSFGGTGRQIFTPVAVALVFMLAGYGHTSAIQPVKPFAGAFDGFRIWSAGMPPACPVWKIYAEIPVDNLVEASYSGLLPAIPGLAFGLPLLVASAALSLIACRRCIWWVTSVMALQVFALIFSGYNDLEISALHPLLLGPIPGLLLVAVADAVALPEEKTGQMIGGILFAAFALLFVFRSENILGPVYGLLLAQIASPLLTDMVVAREQAP